MIKSNTGTTESCWQHGVKMPETTALVENLTCDVCIIGGGLAGITTAYLLSKEGKSVILLEKGEIGGGETGRTTAHLSDALDDRYDTLINVHGLANASLAAQSHAAAIDKIEEIVKAENIDCDFERLNGYLFTLPSDSDDQLAKELEAARQVGLRDVTLLQKCPVPSLSAGQALCFPDQGQFHPLKYLAALTNKILDKNGRIFTNTKVTNVESGAVVRVTTESGFAVSANHVVVATNTPINDWVTMHTKQAPYRTYSIGFKIPHQALPAGLYWDNSDPYHYIRAMKGKAAEGKIDHDILIVGGEDHKTGQENNPQERFNCLEEWTRKHLPMAQEVLYKWSGQVLEPVDYLGFIGRNPGDQNIYIATGDSGHGMTHCTIAGMLITDLILERKNPWEMLYDPARISLTADTAKEFLKENLNVALQYKDWVTPGEAPTGDSLLPNSGCVIWKGAAKVAVYCDEHGNKHERSAVCPHLGCIVNWNDVEKSWDCPCHGSRFNPHGKVITGPAISDLGEA